MRIRSTYGPADMEGQLCWLQIGRPVLRSCSWMILSMPSRRRFCSTTEKVRSGIEGAWKSIQLTLMSKPLALFDQDRLRGERHEVSLNDEVGVLLPEEERRLPVDVDIVLIHRIVKHGRW